MSLQLNPHGVYDSIWDSGRVPKGWRKAVGKEVKVRVKRREILRLLQKKIAGRWRKVYVYGADGSEIHYFQHAATGKVWRVRYFASH